MASLMDCLLTLVAIQASCEKKGSLVLVIDNSISMQDEFSEIKNYIQLIPSYYFTGDGTCIPYEDAVVVTFNDPEVKFLKRTKSGRDFMETLGSIKAEGGGGGPKMALSGIKRALEESLPDSNIYVFTDSSAKDFDMLEEIQTLCMKKRSKITLILSGDSSNVTTAFDKILEACDGEIFRIDKDRYKQALQYVQETIFARRQVVFMAAGSQFSTMNVLRQFHRNESTDSFIVAAFGTNVEVSVKDQKRMELNSSNITWTENVKVLRYDNLPEGEIYVSAKGTPRIRLTVYKSTLDGLRGNKNSDCNNS